MTLYEEYETLVDRAIYGTKENHPEINIGKHMQEAIGMYIAEMEKNDYQSAILSFSKNFSRISHSYGINLREPLLNFCKKENYNIALALMDLLGDYCEIYYEDVRFSDADRLSLMKYYIKYLEGLKNSSMLEPDALFRDGEVNLSDVKKLNDLLAPVMNIYCSRLKKEKVFDFQGIDIHNLTKTGFNFLSNVNSLGALKDSFSGSIGQISISSDRGYPNNGEIKQQDAVLSVVKDKTCFLNVVADGVGSSIYGEKASSYAIDQLKGWFDSVEGSELRNFSQEELKAIIDHLLKKISSDILKKYHNQGYTTIVLALTLDDYTLIANIGDSTAYQYDESTDELTELTTTDSITQGMDYEKARNYFGSNQIDKALGLPPYTDSEYAHYKVIPNDGRRIILSSDGVTDLIRVERFKNYFKEKTPADEIVEDAVYSPDPSENGKEEDNVSAIVIDLPDNQYELGRSL